jgi:F-type H+-transporting ATPase subunit b
MSYRQVQYHKALLRNALYFAAFLLIFLSAATAAQAAEENGNSTGNAAAEIFKWINFAIVAGVIVWVFAKKLPPIFRGNAEKISSAISKATAAKAEADRQLKEAENKLANMRQEIDALRATAEKDGVAESERIWNQTMSDAKRISAAAKMEIEAAERAARLELKGIAAKLAIDGAEALLVKQLTPAAQDAVVANFAKSLEGKTH